MQTEAPPAPPGRRARFHRHGPVVLGGLAIGALIVYELIAHHLVTEEEALFFAALVPSIVLHEISHGVVAYWCGDDTAKRAGRLSLNPLRHIDPLGTIIVPILMIISPLHRAFGWAKPVPINLGRLRHPRNQAVLVALVGPFTNFVLAVVGGFAFRFVTGNVIPLSPSVGEEFLFYFGYANAILCAFNLIPFPPLDGSAILERLLPRHVLPGYYRLRTYLIIAVIFLVYFDTGVLGVVFNYALRFWADICFS